MFTLLQLRHAILLRFFSSDMTRHLVVFLKITEKYLRNAKISNRQLQLNNKIICTSAVLLLFDLAKLGVLGGQALLPGDHHVHGQPEKQGRNMVHDKLERC